MDRDVKLVICFVAETFFYVCFIAFDFTSVLMSLGLYFREFLKNSPLK